jgi:hypothetical protein
VAVLILLCVWFVVCGDVATAFCSCSFFVPDSSSIERYSQQCDISNDIEVGWPFVRHIHFVLDAFLVETLLETKIWGCEARVVTATYLGHQWLVASTSRSPSLGSSTRRNNWTLPAP